MADKRLTFKISEVAEKLGVSKSLCYTMAREGRLPGLRRFGQRRLLVSRYLFELYLNGDGASSPPPAPSPTDEEGKSEH